MLSGLAARLGAGYFTLFVFTGLMGPYLGLWLAGLGHDATTIGLLLALLAATKVGASTLWAWLGDHTGRRARLVKGDLSIVRNEGRYAFVPAAVGLQVKERIERALIHLNVPAAAADENDPYKAYAVPDDLMW